MNFHKKLSVVGKQYINEERFRDRFQMIPDFQDKIDNFEKAY